MKRILSALIMTALMGTGLVALTSQPASAACTPGYASPCINTTTSVSAPASKRAPKSVPIRVSVAAASSTVPSGTVRVVVTKSSNGKVKYDTTQPYVGGQVQFVTQSLRKGTYAVTATFVSTTGSRFNDSTASTSFVIKKKRRR